MRGTNTCEARRRRTFTLGQLLLKKLVLAQVLVREIKFNLTNNLCSKGSGINGGHYQKSTGFPVTVQVLLRGPDGGWSHVFDYFFLKKISGLSV